MKKNIFVKIVFIIFVLTSSTFADEAFFKVTYGISNHDHSITSGTGTPTVDEDDKGFLVSAGTFIGSNWGVDLMYYDLGETKITGNLHDRFTLDNVTYEFDGSGTITNSTDGYGVGLFGVLPSGSLGSIYAKVGIHKWNKSGTTSLTFHDKALANNFYNDGADLYFGIGLDITIYKAISLTTAYDALSFADSTFGSPTGNLGSLLSLGLKVSLN